MGEHTSEGEHKNNQFEVKNIVGSKYKHIHSTHRHILYIYIYMLCICVCVCAADGRINFKEIVPTCVCVCVYIDVFECFHFASLFCSRFVFCCFALHSLWTPSLPLSSVWMSYRFDNERKMKLEVAAVAIAENAA